jgi:cytochrome c biogenesis factor
VVLLGTVFPLVAEAINNSRLTIGRPYFDRMTGPIGFALLFLMAVAPALPWRKASKGVLRDRLLVPAWAGAATLVALVVAGIHNIAALLAFALGAPVPPGCASSCWRRARRVVPVSRGGAVLSGGPTEAWSCTSVSSW